MFSSDTTQVSDGGYQISRSLRFNSADSAYLNRTPASASNRTTWTYSGWIKRSKLGTDQNIFAGNSGASDANFLQIVFVSTDDSLFINGWTTGWKRTSQVFRDVSAWYHIVVVWDTTQATAANRVKLYVNGSQVTAFQTSNDPALNATTGVNAAGNHYISSYNAANQFNDGYMTEVNFIDGQALTPSSFGETNAQTGVWQPKAYSGSYGTNGFYLNFSDNSNTTAATLGKDYSGNGNNWTPNNFSVTAGAGNDSLVDSPTSYGTDTGVGGTVRGNYATLNPLVVNKPTLTNGNLDADGSDLKTAISTMGVSSGKWYWEVLIGSGTNTPNMGVTAYANDNADPGVYLGVGRSYVSSGGGSGVYKPYTATSTTANSAFSNANTAGATIGFALDCDAGTLAYYVNNVLGYTDSTIATGTLLYPMTCNFNSTANNYRNTSFNFGQRPFAYTAPSGYKALCTQNLPTPTIGATTATLANKYFNPVLYTGNGGTQSVTGVGFQPDFTWVKSRTTLNGNGFEDAVRGAGQTLESNNTSAEVGYSAYFTAFTSDGFNMALGGGFFNSNGQNYVAWNWKANGSGSTNTAGSITSTVSANTTSGFSVVTYTGTGASASVGHGLGALPQMIIVKRRNSTADWAVYHRTLGANTYLFLNSTNASASVSNYWQYTTSPGNPTSDWFGIIGGYEVNVSSATYVAYCFAEVAGYSKFGSYTGNGSSDGTFVYTGFRPAYVLIKRTTSAYNWWILDAARGTINAVKGRLYADAADAESTTYPYLDFLSNGFKLRDADGGLNASGEPYIYACFAQNPFKYSLAR